MLKKIRTDERQDLPQPYLRVELDDEDQPTSLGLAAGGTPGGATSVLQSTWTQITESVLVVSHGYCTSTACSVAAETPVSKSNSSKNSNSRPPVAPVSAVSSS